MNHRQFVVSATRAAERALNFPPGWWGTYADFQKAGRR